MTYFITLMTLSLRDLLKKDYNTPTANNNCIQNAYNWDNIIHKPGNLYVHFMRKQLQKVISKVKV